MARLNLKFFGFTALAFLTSVVTACGGHSTFENSMNISDEAKLRMFKAPTQVLTPTTVPTTGSIPTEYSVYNLVSAHFGADTHAMSVSAHIEITSTAGTELVDLIGMIRPDGSASLVDLRPLTDSKNRLVAESLCVDIGTCEEIILNVYYKVSGKTLKKQFSNDALKAPAPDKASGKNPKTARPTKNAPAVDAKIDSTIDGDAIHPSEKKLALETDVSDEKLGDFVGARRNETLIGQLWNRSQTPELPPELSRTEDPKPTLPTAPAKIVKSQTKTVVPPVPQSTKTKTTVQRWMTRVQEWIAPPVNTPTVTSRPIVKPKPGAPSPATSKPTVPPTTPVPLPPDQSRPKPQPVPPAPGPTREEKPAAPRAEPTISAPPLVPAIGPALSPLPIPDLAPAPITSVYPFPPAKPVSTDQQLDQKFSLLEARLAPLLNLIDGGHAQGGYSDSVGRGIKSAIVHSTLLPSNVPGLVPVTVTPSAHYGSGMLVSFLENSATYLLNQLGLKLFVGDMSLIKGGWYGESSSHKTHRNGLDADIAWIGIARPLQTSALNDDGDVIDDFDYQKTWNFLRLAAKQEIVEDAQRETAVSRVFMSPSIKLGFCSWAKENKIFDDPANAELMRLVRPVAGHYKHFHLSLKCSPHYPLCRNLAGPPPLGTGCP